MLSLTWQGALAWRLRRHLLDPVGSTSAAEVVDALGAVAAQLDPAAAELGIRLRRQASLPGDVQRAVGDGWLIRTFAFRGAVHLMTPDQATPHLALGAASRMWERPSWQSHYRLPASDWPDLRSVVREALADGPLTRRQLAAAVGADPRFEHLASAFTDPSATFLKPFAWQGDLSLGSSSGELTLQALDSSPRWTGLPDLDAAGRRAIKLYLRAYGPASEDNLHYWLSEGLGVRRALVGHWISRLGDRLTTVEVEGEPRMVLADDLQELVGTPPTSAVRLLPKYDQWVLGPGTADAHVVPPSLRPEVSRGANLIVSAGVVAGTWSMRGADVVLTWWAGAQEPLRADLDAEIERLGALSSAR